MDKIQGSRGLRREPLRFRVIWGNNAEPLHDDPVEGYFIQATGKRNAKRLSSLSL
ncbi:MAG: hypothetical protein JXA18_01535 [Chitinispirillaceae bacterium]|nr:hypothetical protein [Chitinispirillaceae bacterium]